MFSGPGGNSRQSVIGRDGVSFSPLEVFAGTPGSRVPILPWIGRPDSVCRSLLSIGPLVT